MASIEFTCPCGVKLSSPDLSTFREFVKDHNAQHIEKVLELKSKTPTFSPLQTGGGQVVYNPCSCKVTVTG